MTLSRVDKQIRGNDMGAVSLKSSSNKMFSFTKLDSMIYPSIAHLRSGTGDFTRNMSEKIFRFNWFTFGHTV